MDLTILSYNILAGGQDRLPFITHTIQTCHPDAIALLEARSPSNVEILAQQLGMNWIIGPANNVFQDHIAWLSRFPIVRKENHRLPVFAKTLLEIEVLREGCTFSLFATHLKAGYDHERESFRRKEMQMILKILGSCNNPLHVIVGDLNTIHPMDQPDLPECVDLLRKRGDQFLPLFPRKVIPLLEDQGYVDCYRRVHPKTAGYTTDTTHPALRVDYIFASSSLAPCLQACDIITEGEARTASDHFPIWATFQIG